MNLISAQVSHQSLSHFLVFKNLGVFFNFFMGLKDSATFERNKLVLKRAYEHYIFEPVDSLFFAQLNKNSTLNKKV